ncbi:MAG TPA: VWA domain-containing protein [Blastocatellia bacterium]|nr:VWA domain-containing protein [Blastocatellia bacterium]
MKNLSPARARRRALTVLSGLVLALNNLPPAVGQSPGGQAGQDTRASVTVSTREVLLDVIARDKRNRFVKDLTVSDFEVYEDGVPQKIASFRLVTREAEGNAGPKVTQGNSPNDPVSLGSSFSTVAMVFDNLKPEFRPYACKAAQAYADENVSAKDFVGVFAVDLNLNPVQAFTRDAREVRRAIERIQSLAYVTTGAPGAGLDKRPSFADLTEYRKEQLAAAAGGPGAAATGAGSYVKIKMAEMTADIIEGFAQLETQRKGWAVVNGLAAIINAQQRLAGRKAIIFFSDELTIAPEVQAQFGSLISAANRANVTIYTVDAAGLRAESQTGESARQLRALSDASVARADSGGPILGGAISKDLEKNEYLVASGANTRLGQLAIGTGGFLVSDTNDLARRLGRVDEELRTYYLLSYTPANQNYDGKFRRIEVKLKRPDLLVQSRRGYFAVGPGASVLNFETPVLAVLNNPTPPAAFPFKTLTLSFPQAAALARVPVMAQIPPGSVTFVENKAAGSWATDFRVVALIKDPDRQVVKKLSQQFQLTGPLDKLEEARRNGLLFYREAELPTGRYEVDTVAYDTPTAKASVQHSSVEVMAEGEGRLSLSSVIIVRSASPATAAQKTENLFVAGDLLLVPNFGEPIRRSASKQFPFYFTVRPAMGGTAPTAELEILQSGQSLARLPLPLPAADASGRIQFASSLPTESIPPGTYELKVTVQDGRDKLSRSAFFTLEP